jgi:NADPH:quinone reductase-like Zn-dependent oxidoreductase
MIRRGLLVGLADDGDEDAVLLEAAPGAVAGRAADHVIDYKAQKFEDIAKDVDVVLDTVGGDTQKRSWGVMKENGILVSIVGAPDQLAATTHKVRATAMLAHPDAKALADISTLIDAGRLKPVISRTFPLADAAKAHEQIHTGHTRGKIVLKVMDEADPKGGK